MDNIDINKPWFKLDPNNFSDRWWLYTSIVDTETAKIQKTEADVLCYLIIQDHNISSAFYRISTWYKNDPNRYVTIDSDYTWKFNKKLIDIKEGDIINIENGKFYAYNCKYVLPHQKEFCKILERID